MIAGEDAVCWHSLSERLVLCLAESVIDHYVVCSALKMKLTLKIRRYFLLKDGAVFFKSEGATVILGPSNKKVRGPGPPRPPVTTPMSKCHPVA